MRFILIIALVGCSTSTPPFRHKSQDWLIKEESSCDKNKNYSYYCEAVRMESGRAND